MSGLREKLDALRLRRQSAEGSSIAGADPDTAIPVAAFRPGPRAVQDVFGGCAWGGDGGECWCVHTPLERPPGDDGALNGFGDGPIVFDVNLESPVEIHPLRAMLLDIETGGFSGSPVFLIGAILLSERELRVTQWLARDYPEERAILQGLAQAAAQHRTWITFNGKSFDAPFLRDRAIVHRVPLNEAATHLDLLHVARRRWRGRLPNFRLETIEHMLCGAARIGDVPSADIPALFHHFIRTGNAAPLRPVLEHNQRDLITCLELLRRLLGGWMPRMVEGG